jgi:hypothetical protein
MRVSVNNMLMLDGTSSSRGDKVGWMDAICDGIEIVASSSWTKYSQQMIDWLVDDSFIHSYVTESAAEIHS